MSDLTEYRKVVKKSLNELILSIEELRNFYNEKAKTLLPEIEPGLDVIEGSFSLINNHLNDDALENMSEDELIEQGGIISRLKKEALAINALLERMIR